MNQLFKELADWNHQLEHCEGLKEALAALDAEHDVAVNQHACAAPDCDDEFAP